MDTSDRKRSKTFKHIHYQKYYTDLTSFYKIFFSDLAFHLLPINSLNNILIILLNFTVDRKSELILTTAFCKVMGVISWSDFLLRSFVTGIPWYSQID